MDTEVFRAWIVSAAAVIEANRDHLTQLDAAIGDADHGINLARGFAAVTAALELADVETARTRPASPGAVLTLTGSTLISKVGGASGPLQQIIITVTNRIRTSQGAGPRLGIATRRGCGAARRKLAFYDESPIPGNRTCP